MSPTLDKLAGRLTVHSGTAQPLSGGRPIVMPATLQRLCAGLPAAELPRRLGSVFTLCATAHRLTSARAVQSALGRHEPSATPAREELLLRLWTAREHLQRLALDLPLRLPLPGLRADPSWLRGMPLMALPDALNAGDEVELHALHDALLPWLESNLIGGPAERWLADWEQELDAPPVQDSSTARWCAATPLPLARWLYAARPCALALQLPARPLEPLDAKGGAALAGLAAQMAADETFAAAPEWSGAPAETGCWTRAILPVAQRRPQNAWMRWLHRIAELLRLALPARWLSAGALATGEGAGLAWTEMSRGLLIHWVQLDGHGDAARVRACRVLAPTEWNFHPRGTLAMALRASGLASDAVRAAVAALDACVEVDVQVAAQAGHA